MGSNHTPNKAKGRAPTANVANTGAPPGRQRCGHRCAVRRILKLRRQFPRNSGIERENILDTEMSRIAAVTFENAEVSAKQAAVRESAPANILN